MQVRTLPELVSLAERVGIGSVRTGGLGGALIGEKGAALPFSPFEDVPHVAEDQACRPQNHLGQEALMTPYPLPAPEAGRPRDVRGRAGE